MRANAATAPGNPSDLTGRQPEMTVQLTHPAAAAAVPCPPWCGYGPHTGLDVHLSDSTAVPAANNWHWCHSDGEDTCSEDVCAQLVQDDTGTVTLEITHAESDCMPPLALEAAAELARGILALVALAGAR